MTREKVQRPCLVLGCWIYCLAEVAVRCPSDLGAFRHSGFPTVPVEPLVVLRKAEK
jgi:hypothetical protein